MLTIQVDDKALRDVLASLTRKMSDLTPVMNSIGMEMESRVSGRFQSRTDPKWSGLGTVGTGDAEVLPAEGKSQAVGPLWRYAAEPEPPGDEGQRAYRFWQGLFDLS